jgi:hypothetical protein
LKYNYTIDQVNLFYEKQVKKDLDSWKMDAVIAGNAMMYGAEVDSRNAARRKMEAWKTFLNSLTWEKIQEKGNKKMTVSDVLGPLGAVGHLIKFKKGDS